MNVILQMETARLAREKEALEQVSESLKNALPWLEQARCLMEANRLQERYPQLFEAVCDATHYSQVAVDSLQDQPDA
jgi:4-hydroxy-3-methylbut-2-enyl diphosphate reductase IspH